MQDHITPDLTDLAEWSDWVPLQEARTRAPRLPGVYVIRDANTVQPVYVGMAGERRGAGIQGRLSVYLSGKGAVSGFGEAAFDRALADPTWIQGQLDSLTTQGPTRAKEWAARALSRLPFEAAWSTTADRASALVLEHSVVQRLRPHIWNK